MTALMSDGAREAFVRRIRLEMAKRGLTREALAELASVKERTLGNLLSGQSVRDVTVARIARALDIELEAWTAPEAAQTPPPAPDSARAAEAYGGYMMAAWEPYIGAYVAYRRVFSPGDQLYRSIYDIDWDEALSRLRFLELQRFKGRNNKTVTMNHGGGIYISPHTGLLQLLTTFQGALRLVTLTKFRMADNRLRGVILTQSDRDHFFEPSVSAIYLQRIEGKSKLADLERLVGPVGPDDPAFADASAELADIERSGVFIAGLRR
jgi:transcriptional regulator with XRE-family HTH domain